MTTTSKINFLFLQCAKLQNDLAEILAFGWCPRDPDEPSNKNIESVKRRMQIVNEAMESLEVDIREIQTDYFKRK